jgi:UDP-GlcNAc:undecaprenyl-phosphate GlcNAc-1-phosphate transferase
MAFAVVFGLAFALALVLTPVSARLGRRLGAVDEPGGRRQHPGPVSRLGGLALFPAFAVAVAVAQLVPGVERTDPKEIVRLAGLLAGSALLFVVGVIDDRRELPAWPQFLAQGAAAGIAIAFQIFIEYVNNPLSADPLRDPTIDWPYAFTVIFTLFWIMGMINTVNWLDGVDGLAVGVTAILALIMFVNSAFRLVPAQTSVSLLPLALAGACLGFLPFNFYPARVFVGSAGALFLGYALGTLSIIGGAKVATVLLVMLAPILDVAWQIVRRLRSGHSPAVGDRGHLHFRLLDLGVPPRVIVLSYYAFCALFGLLTLLLPSPIYKLVALAALGLAVLGVMLAVARAGRAAGGTRLKPGA